MFGMFDKKKNSDAPRMSMGEKIRSDKKKQAEDTRKAVFDALQQTETQKNLYATMAQRAITKAKQAEAAHDAAGKRIAYNELKFAYGVYQYMGKLYDAFRAIKSQLDIQEVTENFAGVVNSLSKIRVPAQSFNFDKLTETALKGFQPIDTSGLDNMVQRLLEGSVQASSVSDASDSFLDKLVSGEITLDTPYSMPATTNTAGATAEQKMTDTPEVPAQTSNMDDALSMLNAITAGLRGSNQD